TPEPPDLDPDVLARSSPGIVRGNQCDRPIDGSSEPLELDWDRLRRSEFLRQNDHWTDEVALVELALEFLAVPTVSMDDHQHVCPLDPRRRERGVEYAVVKRLL